MDKPNNREAYDREPRAEDDDSDPLSEPVSGTYYYDDSTGYEVYQGDDDESSDDESDGSKEA